MTAADLLPSNATQLERDLSRSGDVIPRIGAGVQRIRDAKRVNIPDSVVPWLIYEYGLGEITPYVPDLRQALVDGIQWQRLRGTRRAIEIGLGWINFDGTIEESEANTRRWSDWQLGLDRVPTTLDEIPRVVGISGLSSPIRSRLARVYSGYDERRFILDDHKLGEGLLCDHSGVYLREDWPQLSFGRQWETLLDTSEEGEFRLGIERISGIQWIYEDKFILSQSELDEWWHLSDVGSSQRSRLHFYTSGPLEISCEIYPPREYAWTGIYLSDDGWKLDDTHAAFSHRLEYTVGFDGFVLSEGNAATGEGILSEHVTRTEYRELLKREDRVFSRELAYEQPPVELLQARHTVRAAVVTYEDRFLLSAGILDEQWHLLDDDTRLGTHSRLWVYGDPALETWGAYTWNQAGTWQAMALGHHRTEERAGIYLSEDYRLGDTNTRFHVEAWAELGMGAFLLSEAEPGTLITAPDWDGLAQLGYITETGDGPFILSDSELGEHLADAQVAPAEYASNGLHRLSEHLVRREPVGQVEVYERAFGLAVDVAILLGVQSVTRRERYVVAVYEDRFTTSASILDEQWHLADLQSRDVQHTRTWAYDGEAITEASNTRAHTDTGLGQDGTFIQEASHTAEREQVFAYLGEAITEASNTAERTRVHVYDGEQVAEASYLVAVTSAAAGQGDTTISEASRTADHTNLTLVEVELLSSKTAEHGSALRYYGDAISTWSADITWNQAGTWNLLGRTLTRTHGDLTEVSVALESAINHDREITANGWVAFTGWESDSNWSTGYWNETAVLIESDHESAP